MTTRILLMTAIYAGLTLPCPLTFSRARTVLDMPGHELEASRRSLNQLAKSEKLPDLVIARNIPDIDVRTLRMFIRHAYRPVLVVHASRNPEEAAVLAHGMGKPPPTAQAWTTRMMRVQNIVAEFGRLDVSGSYIVYVYADDGVKAAQEAVDALVAKAMAEPPPDRDCRLLPALANSARATTRERPWCCGTWRCHAWFSSQRVLTYLLLRDMSRSLVVLSNRLMLWIKQRAYFMFGGVTWVGWVTLVSSRVLIGGCACDRSGHGLRVDGVALDHRDASSGQSRSNVS